MFLASFLLQFALISQAQSATVDLSLEASVLKSGYAIQLLKPLPRRNSGCDTIFKSGKVSETCEPNYGFDPAIEGVIRNYCEWNLNSHYDQNNSSRWLEPYFNPKLIVITDAKIGFGKHDEYRTIIHKVRNTEYITYRWIELEFNDGVTGTKLGSLKCYPSQINEYNPFKSDLYGRYIYDYRLSKEQNVSEIKSGLTIGNVLHQLAGYVELIKLN